MTKENNAVGRAEPSIVASAGRDTSFQHRRCFPKPNQNGQQFSSTKARAQEKWKHFYVRSLKYQMDKNEYNEKPWW